MHLHRSSKRKSRLTSLLSRKDPISPSEIPDGDSETRRRPQKLRVLLTNGRFPVTIDLARQFHDAGHKVYVVDPMHFHVCFFSNAVRKSYFSPAPFFDSKGYIECVKNVIQQSKIDLVVPMHEEVFYLARSEEPEILSRLFAPPREVLFMLHNKWEFGKYLERSGLDKPEALLIKSMDDVKNLDLTKEWALKPVYGRASSKVYHIKPGEPLPEDVDVADDNHYVAQEWLKGARYCTYSVIIKGRVRASVVYPVLDTLDGSSCVYFEALDHPKIQVYIQKIVEGLGRINGQLAFDFIDTGALDFHEEGAGNKRDVNSNPRLVAIECNPRATSGIHLWGKTPHLANVIASGLDLQENAGAVAVSISQPLVERPLTLVPQPTETEGLAAPFPHGEARQVAPGMLMGGKHSQATWSQYLNHMKHLITTKDATFSWKDIGPTLMQPFLLTSYYKICHERGGVKLADMFQSDLIWAVNSEEMEKVRRELDEYVAKSEGARKKIEDTVTKHSPGVTY